MVNHGVTGPNVRAAGVDYDVRWAHPYSVYSELDWAPAVERSSIKGADCYDRYRVRVTEMVESPTTLRIAGENQCSTLSEGEKDAARIHIGCPSALQCS